MVQTTKYVYAILGFLAIMTALYGTSPVLPNADYLAARVKQVIPDDPPAMPQQQGGGGRK